MNTLAAKEKNTDYMLNLYKLDIPFDMDAGTYRHYILVTDADGKQFYVSYDFSVNSRLNASELWATGALSVGMTKDEIFGALPSYWQKTNYEIGGGSFALYFVFIDDVKSSIAVVYDENDVSTNIVPLGAGVDRQFILDCLGKPDIQDESSVLYTFGSLVNEDVSEKLVELTVTFDADGNYEDWTCDTSVILPDGFPQVISDYVDSINDKDYEKLKSLYMESGLTGALMRQYIDSDWAREEEESGLFSYDNIRLTSAEKTEVRYKASLSTDYEQEWKCHLAIKTKHGGNEYKVYEFEIYYMKDGRVLIGDTFESNSYSYTPIYPPKKPDKSEGDTVSESMTASELWATGALSVGMPKAAILNAIPSYWETTNYEIGGGSFALYFESDDVKSSIAVVYDENDVSTNIALLGAGVDRQFILDCLGEPDRQDKNSVVYTFGRIVDEDKSENSVELTVTFDAEGNYEDMTCGTSVILPDTFPQVISDYIDMINNDDDNAIDDAYYDKFLSLFVDTDDASWSLSILNYKSSRDYNLAENGSFGVFGFEYMRLTSAKKMDVVYKATSTTDFDIDWSNIAKREDWECFVDIKTKSTYAGKAQSGPNRYEFRIYYLKDGGTLIGSVWRDPFYDPTSNE